MKVSLNLLKEFAGFDEPVDKIIETISTKIGEVESVESLGGLYKGIVIGRILDSRPHPDADKLSVNMVDIGKKRPIQVIAGDKTLKEGDYVAYIPPGNIVPVTANGAEVKLDIRKIRGLDSHGMLASEHELNFSSAHEGVLKLDTTASQGTALSKLYALDDHIIDVETKVLTHRPDMFGHLGFARELSAALGRKFTSPGWYLERKPPWGKANDGLAVSLDNKLKYLVPRFTLVAYEGVIVGPSPVKIQSWLMRLGIRPINNVVDLTNYVMIISGQPLHAFDYDKVAGNLHEAKFVVRHPKPGEKLTLLNGTTIKPHTDAIAIAGHKDLISLGGVMGGIDTEVDDQTKRVVLEAANFNMYSIRNTSRTHGITNEAVTRFARGQDPDSIVSVQSFAKDLMDEWTGAKPAGALIDEYPKPRKTKEVSASADAVNSLLGIDVKPADMAKTLSNAELEVRRHGQKLDVTIPTWRPDLNIEADIAEEIGRLNGYFKIVPNLPKREIIPADLTPLRKMELETGNILSGGGANEIFSYSGVPEKLLLSTGQDIKEAYRVRNALSPNIELMRLSLTPSLLEKIYPNLRLGYGRFALFELGTVHNKHLIENKLPIEQSSLGLVYTAGSKVKTGGGAAYFMARTYLSYLSDKLGYNYELTTSRPAGDPWLSQASAPYEPSRSAYIRIGGLTVGVIGEFTFKTTRNLRLPGQTAGFELQLERILTAAEPTSRYQKLSKYPPVVVDLTLKSSQDLPFSKISAAINSCSFKEADFNSMPIEVFEPGKNNKHTTFRLEFSSQKRTLTQKEVNSWLQKIVKTVHKRTGAVQV